jgi:putative redox protein
MGKMNTVTKWKKDLAFEVVAREHSVILDTRIENAPGAGPTPKEMLLGAVSACSGIDVASILQKMRVQLDSCEVFAEAETTSEHPAIFKEIILRFEIKGPDIKEAQAQKAVNLSMTKYCGVSAMVFQTSPIRYEIVLNGQSLGEAKAHFDLPKITES